MWICVHSKDAQRQLMRTFLKAAKLRRDLVGFISSRRSGKEPALFPRSFLGEERGQDTSDRRKSSLQWWNKNKERKLFFPVRREEVFDGFCQSLIAPEAWKECSCQCYSASDIARKAYRPFHRPTYSHSAFNVCLGSLSCQFECG